MPLDQTRAPALEPEIARLRDLDLDALCTRWRALTGRKAPPHVPKHLLLRLLAYRIQADALGDLDPATIRYLDRIASAGRKASASADPASPDLKVRHAAAPRVERGSARGH